MSASTTTGLGIDDLAVFMERGWPIFPQHGTRDGACLCRRGTECDSAGKHPIPRNGRTAATLDREQVERWVREHPCSNWAALTGSPSGIFVLDIDGDEGFDSFGLLVGEHGPLAAHAFYADGVAAKSSRGYHVYMGIPDGLTIPTMSPGKLAPGIEVKGERANITLPGSRHVSGTRYEWLDPLPDGPLPEPRQWLLDMILRPAPAPRAAAPPPPPTDPDRAQRYGLAGLQRELDELAATEPGGRNDRLNIAAFSAGQLVAGGCLDYDYAVGELLRVALEIRLPVAEAEGTIRSGMEGGAKSPRTAPK